VLTALHLEQIFHPLCDSDGFISLTANGADDIQAFIEIGFCVGDHD